MTTTPRDTLSAGRLHMRRASEARRQFLERPYASVQLLLFTTGGLLLFGVLMAVSTTISASRDGDVSIWSQAVKEAEFVVVGLLVFWLAARMSPRLLRGLAYPALALAVVLLVAVLVPGIGVTINGAKRWLDFGPIQVQPSEFAKLAILLWGADLLARKQRLGTLTRARHLFVPLVPGVAIIAALVMAEPDLGTTLCFMIVLLGLLWTVGMPLRYFVVVVGLVAGAVTLLAIAAPYRLARLTTFVDPFKDAQGNGYHTVEGLYALASGGLFGVGLGQGTSKYGYVPNANSDYVFSIIGEELGFLGCVAVLLLFALLAYAGMRVVRRNADPFVRLAGGGATIWLCGQAVVNVGYVCGLLPVTGIPLPLISAGGTSLLVSFFVLGMLVSFARHEGAAVAAARRSDRLARRTRLERWARIPVPKVAAARPPAGRAAVSRRTADVVAPDWGSPRRTTAASATGRRAAAPPVPRRGNASAVPPGRARSSRSRAS